jgi:hypothetical protein
MTIWTDHTLSPLVHHFEQLDGEADVRGLLTFLLAWMPQTLNTTMPEGIRNSLQTVVESSGFQGMPAETQMKAMALSLTQAATPGEERALLARRPDIRLTGDVGQELEAFFNLYPRVKQLLKPEVLAP